MWVIALNTRERQTNNKQERERERQLNKQESPTNKKGKQMRERGHHPTQQVTTQERERESKTHTQLVSEGLGCTLKTCQGLGRGHLVSTPVVNKDSVVKLVTGEHLMRVVINEYSTPSQAVPKEGTEILLLLNHVLSVEVILAKVAAHGVKAVKHSISIGLDTSSEDGQLIALVKELVKEGIDAQPQNIVKLKQFPLELKLEHTAVQSR